MSDVCRKYVGQRLRLKGVNRQCKCRRFSEGSVGRPVGRACRRVALGVPRAPSDQGDIKSGTRPYIYINLSLSLSLSFAKCGVCAVSVLPVDASTFVSQSFQKDATKEATSTSVVLSQNGDGHIRSVCFTPCCEHMYSIHD